MGKIKKDAKKQHEKLVALLEVHSDPTSSDRSSVSSKLCPLNIWSSWLVGDRNSVKPRQ
jgi:hypothetical protein